MDPVISRKQEGQQTDGISVLLDQGSYIRPGEMGGHPRLAGLCSEEAGNWEHLVEVINVWGGENRSFWMAHYKAQVLPNTLSPKPKNSKLSMYSDLALDIWCFKYKNYRPSAKDSGACLWKAFWRSRTCYISHPQVTRPSMLINRVVVGTGLVTVFSFREYRK